MRLARLSASRLKVLRQHPPAFSFEQVAPSETVVSYVNKGPTHPKATIEGCFKDNITSNLSSNEGVNDALSGSDPRRTPSLEARIEKANACAVLIGVIAPGALGPTRYNPDVLNGPPFQRPHEVPLSIFATVWNFVFVVPGDAQIPASDKWPEDLLIWCYVVMRGGTH
jgi:hypothetical protein